MCLTENYRHISVVSICLPSLLQRYRHVKKNTILACHRCAFGWHFLFECNVAVYYFLTLTSTHITMFQLLRFLQSSYNQRHQSPYTHSSPAQPSGVPLPSSAIRLGLMDRHWMRNPRTLRHRRDLRALPQLSPLASMKKPPRNCGCRVRRRNSCLGRYAGIVRWLYGGI